MPSCIWCSSPWCLSPALTHDHAFAHPFSLGVWHSHLWETFRTWLFLQQSQKGALSSPKDANVFAPSPSWWCFHPLSSCHVPASTHTGVNCTDGEMVSDVSYCHFQPTTGECLPLGKAVNFKSLSFVDLLPILRLLPLLPSTCLCWNSTFLLACFEGMFPWLSCPFFSYLQSFVTAFFTPKRKKCTVPLSSFSGAFTH